MAFNKQLALVLQVIPVQIHRRVPLLTTAKRILRCTALPLTSNQFAYPRTPQQPIPHGLGVAYMLIVKLTSGSLNQLPILITDAHMINTRSLGTMVAHQSIILAVVEVVTSFFSSVNSGTWPTRVKIFGQIKTATRPVLPLTERVAQEHATVVRNVWWKKEKN